MISIKHEILFKPSLNFKVVEHCGSYYIMRDNMFSDNIAVFLIQLIRSGSSIYRDNTNRPMKFSNPKEALKFWVDSKNLDQIRSAFGYDHYENLKGSKFICDRDSLIEQYPEIII